MQPKENGIHIAAAGFDYDRILKPMLNRYPVEKLVLLASPSTSYPGPTGLSQHFVEKLKNDLMDVEVREVDIYDFDGVFSSVMDVIKEEADSKIYINVSSAPKLTLVAMISAAFMMKKRADIEVFYASPEEYLVPEIVEKLKDPENNVDELEELGKNFLEGGTARGLKEYEDIPIFPVKGITARDRDILKVLKSSEGVDSIKELVDRVNEKKEESIERSSIQYRLDKLKEDGLVYTERENKNLNIYITRVGKVYLEGR